MLNELRALNNKNENFSLNEKIQEDENKISIEQR
jgi:hypothetical protein